MGRKTGVSEEEKEAGRWEGRTATRASHAVCHRQSSHPSPAGAAPRGAVAVPSHSIQTSYTDPPNLHFSLSPSYRRRSPSLFASVFDERGKRSVWVPRQDVLVQYVTASLPLLPQDQQSSRSKF